MATYDYMTSLKNSGRKVQVESAKRDGDGKNIANNYAKQVGYYEGMGVGTADNLTPYSENSGIAQHEPFVFQSTAGGSDVFALCLLKALRGQSYVLNQLVDIFVSEETPSGVTVTALNSGKKIELSGSANGYFTLTKEFGKTIPIGHKLLVKGNFSNTSSLGNSLLGFRIRNANNLDITKSFADTNNFNYIYTTSIAVDRFQLYGPNTGDFTGISLENIQVIDLTQMFGAGNEPTTVEEFNRLFPSFYYEYNVGELVSCQASKLITVGYNQFDGEFTGNTYKQSLNLIRVIPGQTYVLEQEETGFNAKVIYQYDSSGQTAIKSNYLNVSQTSSEFTVENECCYIRFIYDYTGITVSTPTNVCVHLKWDGSKTGYEPYSKHEYGLPNEVLRSAGSAYDEIKSNGTKITRIGSYTFTGNETGTIINTDSETGIVTVRFAILNSLGKTNGEMLAPVGTKAAYASYLYTHSGYYFMAGSNVVDFNLGKADVASTLAQLTGKTIYFELGTPVESESIAFQENIAVDDWGTMEFISTYPQGNDFFYYVDYKAFIDSLGNREDIGFDAGKIVSQEQLNDAVGDIDLTGYVKKTDLSIAYSDYQALSSNQQQALLDTGVQIIGTINASVGGGNVVNPVLYPRRNFGTYSQGIFIAGSTTNAPTVGTYEQNHSATNLTIKVLFRGVDERLTITKLSRMNANNSGYGLIPPNTNGYTADKTFATTDNIGLKTLNAPSDANNLTDEEYNSLIGGCVINGSFLGLSDGAIFYKPVTSTATAHYGRIDCSSKISFYKITLNGALKKIQLSEPSTNLDIYAQKFRGKNLPAYPSDTGTFVLKCVDGVLTWVAE